MTQPVSGDQDPLSFLRFSGPPVPPSPPLEGEGEGLCKLAPLSYIGACPCPSSAFGCWKEDRMGMGPKKCFLHVAVMGALLAVGTTEGECGACQYG